MTEKSDRDHDEERIQAFAAEIQSTHSRITDQLQAIIDGVVDGLWTTEDAMRIASILLPDPDFGERLLTEIVASSFLKREAQNERQPRPLPDPAVGPEVFAKSLLERGSSPVLSMAIVACDFAADRYDRSFAEGVLQHLPLTPELILEFDDLVGRFGRVTRLLGDEALDLSGALRDHQFADVEGIFSRVKVALEREDALDAVQTLLNRHMSTWEFRARLKTWHDHGFHSILFIAPGDEEDRVIASWSYEDQLSFRTTEDGVTSIVLDLGDDEPLELPLADAIYDLREIYLPAALDRGVRIEPIHDPDEDQIRRDLEDAQAEAACQQLRYSIDLATLSLPDDHPAQFFLSGCRSVFEDDVAQILVLLGGRVKLLDFTPAAFEHFAITADGLRLGELEFAWSEFDEPSEADEHPKVDGRSIEIQAISVAPDRLSDLIASLGNFLDRDSEAPIAVQIGGDGYMFQEDEIQLVDDRDEDEPHDADFQIEFGECPPVSGAIIGDWYSVSDDNKVFSVRLMDGRLLRFEAEADPL